MVQENTKTEVTEVKGSLTYEDKVIQKIVGLALESVNGLLSVDGGFFSNLTGKLVNTDDVTVVDIKTKEQQKDDEKSLQDRVIGAAQTTGKFTSDQVDKVKEKVDDMGDYARVKQESI